MLIIDPKHKLGLIMKQILLIFLATISLSALSADCFYAVNLSCRLESKISIDNYYYSNINLVVSSNYQKLKPGRTIPTCTESSVVGLATADMLEITKGLGIVCKNNSVAEVLNYEDSFGIFAIVHDKRITPNAEISAKEVAMRNSQKCVDSTFTKKCLTLNHFSTISIEQYLNW